LVKEICELGGEVSAFVPPPAEAALKRKVGVGVKDSKRKTGGRNQVFEI